MGARRGFHPAHRPLAIVTATGAVFLAACGSAAPDSGTSTGGGRRAGQGRQTGDGSGHAARDSFTGTVRSASGKYSGATGRVHVYLRPQGHRVRRSLTLTLAPSSCPAGAKCLKLSGTLTGTLAPGPGHLPDTGHGYLLNATGTVRPLGMVTARGGVEGTGFIRRGQETLNVTLTGPSVRIAIEALSAPVSGFTSP